MKRTWLILGLAAGAVCYQIFLPPVVGLANNGDFGKIAGVFRLGSPLEGVNVARYSYTSLVFDQKFYYESGFASSESILLRIALTLNAVLSKTGAFDLRIMGAVHASIFLLSFYLLLSFANQLNGPARLVTLFLALAIFTDVMYVSYFNSFYMDTAAFLFLLLTIVSFLRALLWRRAVDRWLFVVSLVFLVCSKTQHYPLGILLAIFLAWKGTLLTTERSKTFAMLSAGVALAAAAFSSQAAPKIYHAQGCYSLIFNELLPESWNVDQELADLGLDGSYRRYIGSSACSAGSGLQDPEFTSAFARRMSYSRLAWFFLTHPSEALRVTIYSLGEAGRQRPFFGNFDVSAGFPPLTQSQSFALWSNFKVRNFGGRGVRYLVYSLLLVLGVPVLALLQRHRLPEGIPAAAGVLAAMCLTELTIASLADALDYQRHFFIFNTLTDLLLISGVLLVTLAISNLGKVWAKGS